MLFTCCKRPCLFFCRWGNGSYVGYWMAELLGLGVNMLIITNCFIEQQIRKLRRELDASQEKVAALTSQLSANVSNLVYQLTKNALTERQSQTHNRPFCGIPL